VGKEFTTKSGNQPTSGTCFAYRDWWSRSQTLLQQRPSEDRMTPPASAEALVIAAIEVLARYLPPDGISKDEAINELLELFDCPKALEIYEAEMNRRNPRDADNWA
jgi:hypothetical protein